MQSSCNQQCRLILIQLLHRQGSCSIQSVKFLSEWASFVWTVFLKRYLFIFWRKIFNQLCLILCFFRRFVRRGFHIRLVKTQPLQACGVGLDHVLSYVGCFGLFAIFSLFSFWPSTKRSWEEKRWLKKQKKQNLLIFVSCSKEFIKNHHTC